MPPQKQSNNLREWSREQKKMIILENVKIMTLTKNSPETALKERNNI